MITRASRLAVINIRYHIITLVAVFLALAVGIVAGSTVIQQSLVNSLETQRRRNIEKSLDDLEKRNSELSEEVVQLRDREKALDDQGPAQLLEDRLDRLDGADDRRRRDRRGRR